MADPLNLLLAIALVSCFAGPACAQQAVATLPDPMRPPIGLESALVAAQKTATQPGVDRLQAVVLHRAAKPVAVINGETVVLGGKFGDAKLVRLTSSEAVLVGPQGRAVLRLTPGAGKVPVQSAERERK